MDRRLLGKLRCVDCGGLEVLLEAEGPANLDQVVTGTVICDDCGRVMRITDRIIQCSPATDDQRDIWEGLYEAQNESLRGVIESLENGFANPDALRAYYPILRIIGDLPDHVGSSVELGCGSGAFSLILKKMGLVDEVTLLDYSMPSLKTAERLFEHFDERCNLVHAKLETHPFREGAFDVSLSGGVIEHFRSRDERLGCLEVHLGPAKLAYIQAPVSAPMYWFQRFAVTVLKRGWPLGFEKPLTVKELKLLLRLAGADILRMDYHYFLSVLALRKPSLMKWRWFARRIWFTRPLRTEIAVLVSRKPR